jgi:hypothetical protein
MTSHEVISPKRSTLAFSYLLSRNDSNTFAPVQRVATDLILLDRLFKGFDAATDLLGFGYSAFTGQDVCDLFLKFDG